MINKKQAIIIDLLDFERELALSNRELATKFTEGVMEEVSNDSYSGNTWVFDNLEKDEKTQILKCLDMSMDEYLKTPIVWWISW